MLSWLYELIDIIVLIRLNVIKYRLQRVVSVLMAVASHAWLYSEYGVLLFLGTFVLLGENTPDHYNINRKE